MIRRKVKYRDQNGPQRGDHWGDPVNYCNDGYLLDFIEMGGYIRAIVETIPSGLTAIVYASDIMFVEAPYNCIVRYHSKDMMISLPKIKGEFVRWQADSENLLVALVVVIEPVPEIGFEKGRIISCSPNEIHFLS